MFFGPPPRHVERALTGVLLPWLVTACEHAAPSGAAPRWPSGTVLVLDARPIGVAEVDAAAEIIGLAEPAYALAHQRRIALTNIVLPRVAGELLAGAQRTHALEQAQAARAELVAGRQPANVELRTLEGGFGDLGLEAWRWMLDAPLDTWSEPVETVGAFELLCVRERGTAQSARGVRGRLELYWFSYVGAGDPRTAIEARLDRARLEIVEPAWRDVVPTLWQKRLSVESKP